MHFEGWRECYLSLDITIIFKMIFKLDRSSKSFTGVFLLGVSNSVFMLENIERIIYLVLEEVST